MKLKFNPNLGYQTDEIDSTMAVFEGLTLTLPLPQTAHGINVLAKWEDIYINNPLVLSD